MFDLVMPVSLSEFSRLCSLTARVFGRFARLGWSTEKCILHVQKYYKVRSRLAMTDEQLEHLLAHLRGLSESQTTAIKLKTRKEKRKRRRK